MAIAGGLQRLSGLMSIDKFVHGGQGCVIQYHTLHGNPGETQDALAQSCASLEQYQARYQVSI